MISRPGLSAIDARSLHHAGREPFDLPPRWTSAKEKIKPATPFNFVSTCDTLGGNSGSPAVNRAEELVGLIFDQNLPSLIRDYAYEDQQSRAIVVDVRAILETLRSIYQADGLLKELVNE